MADSLQLPFGSREQRIAHNESWARDLNRARAEWQAMGSKAGFRCECARTDCDLVLELSPDDWDEVRAKPNRFVVAPGHIAPPEVEIVVVKRDEFWIIDKLGEAGRAAAQLA